jgi:short-subunit dehydrogenase
MNFSPKRKSMKTAIVADWHRDCPDRKTELRSIRGRKNVRNAGVMPLSPLEALKVNKWNQMIDVNIRGVLHGIAAGLPVMKKQGFGQFINVSSTAGHAVYPTGAVYSDRYEY